MTGKKLTERIADRAKTVPSSRGKNRASFLAVRDEVAEALKDWPVKAIWETLRAEGKIEFGYDAFISYVNRHIRNRPQHAPLAHAVKSADPPLTPEREPPRSSATTPGFSYNATPNAKSLVG